MQLCQPVTLQPMVTGPGRIHTLKSVSAVVSACDPTAQGDRARKNTYPKESECSCVSL